jgi:hypothetical protein
VTDDWPRARLGKSSEAKIIASRRIRFALVIVAFPTRECFVSGRNSEFRSALIGNFVLRKIWPRKIKLLLVLDLKFVSARRGRPWQIHYSPQHCCKADAIRFVRK